MKQMNKIIEKVKKLSQKEKIIISISAVLVIGALILIGVGMSYSDPESGYLSNQTVEGLTFEKANLVYENGVSTYTVEVVNDLEEEYNLKNIDIIFKDGEGHEIVSLLGYIGDTIKAGETRLIDASIDQEITNITSIEYKINK